LLDLFNTENVLTPQEKVKKVTAILTELNIPDEAKRRKQYYFEKGMKSLEEVQVMAEKKELLRKVAFQLLEREN
jgi:geranylgeranyl pyrophosphate synthase